MAAERAEKEIGDQVDASEEVEEVVRGARAPVRHGHRGPRARACPAKLPSADELAAEVEKFLAGQDDENPPSP